MIRLALGPLRDPLKSPHRGADFGEVLEEQIVILNRPFDAVEHLAGHALIGTDEQEELLMAVGEAPDARRFRERRFPAPSRHREREELALEHGRFDLLDRLDVIVAPRERKGFRQVRFAEAAEALAALITPRGIHHRWQIADLASGF